MTNKIGIGVEASFDTSDVEQKVNRLGQKIAQANRMQFSPVSVKAVDDVLKLTKATSEYVKVSDTLRRRLSATGQADKAVHEWDFEAMFPNATARSAQMLRAGQRILGAGAFTALSQPSPHVQPPPVAPPGGGGHGPGGGLALRVTQAGLSAAGPAGGVAAGALGTGMSAGFGAGLMGLMGGMLALGIGKIVGGVMEKIDQAEANNVALDKLKRTLGDVNVSFEALKSVVHRGADNLKITYSEAGQLASQFVKLGNVTGEQYKAVADELEVGVGVSRSFGMDPAQGVGVMGQMRGIGVTTNTQESRRFALLIGETIGKAGAFAKADEVMEAIAGYTASQTRQNLGVANAGGFAGMYSALAGSGITGMDPAGAGALLQRVNAALMAGGAKGEASQFFTGSIGTDLGLNPYQTRLFREGGAFATMGSTFGEDSIYKRFSGKSIPGAGGDTTFLQMSLEKLRKQYKNPDELAEATANHLGVNMAQAMALHLVKPNEMGGLQRKYGDLTKFSASGISNIVKAEHGTAEDRQGLATAMLGRKDLSSDDKNRITEARGDDQKLRQVLAELSAKYGQERTQGSDIRDSKNALDNIKTAIADQLVPLTNQMRLGIMHIAGKGEKSPAQILAEVLKLESKDKVAGIKGSFDAQKLEAIEEAEAIRVKRNKAVADLKKNAATMTPEEIASAQKNITRLTDEYAHKSEDMRKRIIELREKEAEAIKAEQKALEDRIAASKKSIVDEAAIKADVEKASLVQDGNQSAAEVARLGRTGGGGGRVYGSSGGGAGGPGDALASSLADVKDPEQRKNLAAFLDAIAASEGAGYNTLVGQGKNNKAITDLSKHPNIVGMVTPDGPSTAAGRYQITNSTWRSLSHRGNSDFSPEAQDRAAIELLKRRGALGDVLSGNKEAAVNKLGNEWQGLPSGASPHQGRRSWAEFNRAYEASRAKAGDTTPHTVERGPIPNFTPRPDMTPKLDVLPENAFSRRTDRDFRVSADPFTIQIMDQNGMPRTPPQQIQTRIQSNWRSSMGY